MHIYPEESLDIVVRGNSTSYEIERIMQAVAGVNWD
jgi:hypothetical protein